MSTALTNIAESDFAMCSTKMVATLAPSNTLTDNSNNSTVVSIPLWNKSIKYPKAYRTIGVNGACRSGPQFLKCIHLTERLLLDSKFDRTNSRVNTWRRWRSLIATSVYMEILCSNVVNQLSEKGQINFRGVPECCLRESWKTMKRRLSPNDVVWELRGNERKVRPSRTVFGNQVKRRVSSVSVKDKLFTDSANSLTLESGSQQKSSQSKVKSTSTVHDKNLDHVNGSGDGTSSNITSDMKSEINQHPLVMTDPILVTISTSVSGGIKPSIWPNISKNHITRKTAIISNKTISDVTVNKADSVSLQKQKQSPVVPMLVSASTPSAMAMTSPTVTDTIEDVAKVIIKPQIQTTKSLKTSDTDGKMMKCESTKKKKVPTATLR